MDGWAPPELLNRLDAAISKADDDLRGYTATGQPESPSGDATLKPWDDESSKVAKLNLAAVRNEAEEEEEALAGQDNLPLELRLGMLGGPRIQALQSHAGQALPHFAGASAGPGGRECWSSDAPSGARGSWNECSAAR